MADTKEPGPKPARAPRQTKFSSPERERIRAAIRTYAREARIGSPTLMMHMEEKTGRTIISPSLKTLQRFLKDESFVNDGFVSWCAEFAAKVGTQTPHDMLAHDLGEFFSRGEMDRPADVVPDRLAGEYEIWAGGTKFRDLKIRREGKFENPDVPYGRCRLSGSGRGLKVHETETGPGSEGTDANFRPPANEGVMLFFSPLVFIFLKNAMTRLPSVYWLREREGGRLTGHAMHAVPLEPGSDFPPYSELRNHELRPIAKGTP